MTLPGPDANSDDPGTDPPIWEGTDATTLSIRRLRQRPAAMLSVVLALCLLGGILGWVSGAPSRIEAALGVVGSERSPSTGGGPPDGLRQNPSAPERDLGRAPCQTPVSVVAAADIAGLVRTLAGDLATGQCPKVTVEAEDSAVTAARLAGGGSPPGVWIPDSTLWLRLAAADGVEAYPATGTSIARTPVVIAIPQQVYQAIDGPNVLPAWVVVVDKVINREIPRMSMPSRDTAVGALALVSLNQALLTFYQGDGTGAYLRQTHFRNTLASTEAEADGLLRALAASTPERAGSEVGAFLATEQQLLAYADAGPTVPVTVVGTYDAHIEADYPLAVSQALDGAQAAIADQLLLRLRSPSAVRQLVEYGFRPPRGEVVRPAALTDTGRFPDYPAPTPLPDAAGWRRLVEGWVLTG